MSLVYDPSVFFCDSVEQAKRIILTVPAHVPFDAYWERSTAAAGDIMIDALGVTAASHILDFGCGIGRLAKHLITRTGCRVTGVDISDTMRRFAAEYVASPNFRAIAPQAFHQDPALAGSCTGAYAALALQHCYDPAGEIRGILRVCAPGSPVLLINSRHRFVPTDQGWRNDGKDVDALAREALAFERLVPADDPNLLFEPSAPPTPAEQDHYWMLLRTPA